MNDEEEELNNEMLYPLITSMKNDNTNNLNESSGRTSEKLLKTFTGYDKSLKIILLGDSGVGKTSLLNNLEQKEPEINQVNLSLLLQEINQKKKFYQQIWVLKKDEKMGKKDIKAKIQANLKQQKIVEREWKI